MNLNERPSRLSSAGPPAAVWQRGTETTVTDGWVTDARVMECASLLQTSWVTERQPMLEKRVFCERLQSQCLVWLNASRVILDNCPFVNLTLYSLHIWYKIASKWSQTLLYTIYDMPSHLIDSHTFWVKKKLSLIIKYNCKTVHPQVVIHVLWNF